MAEKNEHPLTTFLIKRPPKPGKEFTVIYSEVGKPIADGLRWSFVPVPGVYVPEEPEEPSEPEPPTGDNLLNNGDFARGLTGWTWYTNGEGVATVENRTAVIRLTRAGNNNQLYQSGLRLAAGKPYRLKFSGKANEALSFKIAVVQHKAPYAAAGLNETVNLLTNVEQFSFDFTTPGNVDLSNCRLRLSFSKPGVYSVSAFSLAETGA